MGIEPFDKAAIEYEWPHATDDPEYNPYRELHLPTRNGEEVVVRKDRGSIVFFSTETNTEIPLPPGSLDVLTRYLKEESKQGHGDTE